VDKKTLMTLGLVIGAFVAFQQIPALNKLVSGGGTTRYDVAAGFWNRNK